MAISDMTPHPRNLCDLALARTRQVRDARAAAEKTGDHTAVSPEKARLGVLAEVAIMVSRTDMEPDYENHSEWRGEVFRLGRDGLGHPYGTPSAITVDHARTCRDFCFTQADRFAIESRVVPDEADREWMDDWEWETRVCDHAYTAALAESYAFWALAFDQASEPDPAAVTALLDALRDRERGFDLPHRFRGDPAPDRTEAWACATGTTSHIEDHYPSRVGSSA